MTEHAAEESAIQTCVRAFYDLARADDLLGPVFNASVKDWPQHPKMMDDFWSGALLGTQRYTAAPFPPHLKLDMTQDEMATFLDKSLRAINGYVNGARVPIPEAKMLRFMVKHNLTTKDFP